MKIIERAFPRSFVHTAYQMIFPFERNCDIGTSKEASISLLKSHVVQYFPHLCEYFSNFNASRIIWFSQLGITWLYI